MTLSFRRYRPDDRDACLALFDGNTPPFFDPLERAEFAAFLDQPQGAYFVLADDGRVAGCGGYFAEAGDCARFSWGMVDRTIHGKGLGRLLAEHRIAAIRAERRFCKIRLGTTHMIAPFFERFGFVRQAVEADGFAPGMDKVVMELDLIGT